ncbi:MAG: metallophosphatase, partial [Lachnospiraceae bacterium]|nr:metallophosphatase [Lachnospiraceae bacterium]
MPSEKETFFSGGISLLSGYVSRVRQEEENVIYAVAGDLFMGSVVDKEYRGLSTIKLFNALQPDIFEVGNHEVDYGLSHLLFLEKCAAFPILCANLYIKELNRRLFMPYFDIERGGVRVRFIGVLTESVSEKISQEELIEIEVGVRDVYKEIDKVFAATDWDRADITILLTHIGIEEDKKLAELIKPEWGVDFIIGAHSHTFMEEPLVVNGITIAQAGLGSSQIGRFDIIFNKRERRIESYKWKLVAPVEEKEGVSGENVIRCGDIVNIEKEG